MYISTKILDLNHFPVPIGYCIDWIYNGNKNTVAMQCPICSKAFCLANHIINNDGAVMPSVVCPYNCGFHVMMIIKNAYSE